MNILISAVHYVLICENIPVVSKLTKQFFTEWLIHWMLLICSPKQVQKFRSIKWMSCICILGPVAHVIHRYITQYGYVAKFTILENFISHSFF